VLLLVGDHVEKSTCFLELELVCLALLDGFVAAPPLRRVAQVVRARRLVSRV